MNIIQRMASKSAGKYVENRVLTVQRQIPPGLSKHDEKILHKIKKRAHVLDKGFKMCGMRFGWTFVIGLIPVVGDVTDFLLSHNLVVKKAEQIENFPPELLARMKANNTVSAGLGFIPFVGDIVLATFKTNSRNAHIVEEFLRERGQENLRNGMAPEPPESRRPWMSSLFGTHQQHHAQA